ncbi:type II toxin-antitoxin system RelB/DinJ family antitoxin [Pseudomonas sp. TWP3-2]|uniref:type II toxin-antitoxin system RelB/DinJ family antitoxin n=1 Tax=Pseudomonas sp. TWP3-2 TaxID=2804574 RepID=UPI003CF533C4
MAALSKTTDVCCRIDEDLMMRATQVFNVCGLTIEDAMRLFLLQVVSNQRMPFDVRVPSKKTASAMREARNICQRFDLIEEMFKCPDM